MHERQTRVVPSEQARVSSWDPQKHHVARRGSVVADHAAPDFGQERVGSRACVPDVVARDARTMVVEGDPEAQDRVVILRVRAGTGAR